MSDDTKMARMLREIEALRAERDIERAKVQTAVRLLSGIHSLRLLSGIHSLLYPARVTHEGKTFEFRTPNDPHKPLQDLSDRIRALPDELAKTREDRCQQKTFEDGMTIADLKALVRDWPETDEHGESCEVWLADVDGLSNQAHTVIPLNLRQSEDGKKVWADLLIGYVS